MALKNLIGQRYRPDRLGCSCANVGVLIVGQLIQYFLSHVGILCDPVANRWVVIFSQSAHELDWCSAVGSDCQPHVCRLVVS